MKQRQWGPDEPLITEVVLARRLGVSADWVRQEAEAGRLPGLPAGEVNLGKGKTVKRYLFDSAETLRILLERTSHTKPGDEE